jgi:hypothetical protein
MARAWLIAGLGLLIMAGEGVAQQSEPAGRSAEEDATKADVASEDGTSATDGAADTGTTTNGDEAAKAKSNSAYPTSRSAATNRKPDLPGYVKFYDPETFFGGEDAGTKWLEFGIEHRTRFESRSDFYRAGVADDERFLLRTRVYLGLREIADPFRFGVEFQDSRQFGSDLPENTRLVDEAELLQAFGELYFDDAFGTNMPLSLRLGRQSFDAVDRRLVARNRDRNTTNAFDGFRARWGNQSSVWEVDAWIFQPVQRELTRFDKPDDETWFYGLTGYYRGWWPYAALEPYYMALDRDARDPARTDQELHTFGLHAYGLFGESGFDWDTNFAYQHGDNGGRHHRAWATHLELGYTCPFEWKPRLAAMLNYATGDRDPTDDDSNRFTQLFGASYSFYGYSGLFNWQNTLSPAMHLSFKPVSDLKVEAWYRMYWLASNADAFSRASRFDPGGDSGNFAGQSLEGRIRYKFNSHLSMDMGYSHFMPGSFTSRTGDPTDDSDYAYIQFVGTL